MRSGGGGINDGGYLLDNGQLLSPRESGSESESCLNNVVVFRPNLQFRLARSV